MPNVVCCPSCQARYQIADQMMGRKLKCSKCGQALQVGPAQPARAGAAKATQAVRSGQVQAATSAPVRPRVSLLEEELALEEAKAQATAAAERDAELDAELFGEKPPETPKYPCPYCDFEVSVDAPYCPACGLSLETGMHDSAKRSKQEKKDLINGIAGIILAFVLAPVMFWGIQMVLGSALAMVITAIEINIIVALGSFSLACRFFHQEPPDFGAIYKVLVWSSLPNFALNWWGQTGLGSMLGAMAISILLSALLCVAILQFTFVKAIGICIAYNILATILSLAGVLLLAAIFITMTPEMAPSAPASPPAAATEPGVPEPGAPEPGAPAGAPATPDE